MFHEKFKFFMMLFVGFIFYHSPLILAADKDVVCNGKIVDIQGNPVPGAYAFLYEMSYETTSFEVKRSLMQQVMSDSKGYFVLRRQRSKNEFQRWATVLVAHKNIGIRWASWDLQSDKTMVLQLGGYGKLSAYVVDANGQPSVGTVVRALCMLPMENSSSEINYFDWFTEKTDETGRFTFNFIPLDVTAEFYIKDKNGKSYCTSERGITGDALSYRCGEKNVQIVLSDKLAMENSVRSISYGAMLANSRYLKMLSNNVRVSPPEEFQTVDIGIQSISGIVIEKPFIPLTDVKIAIYDVLKDKSQPFGFVVKAVGEATTDASGQYSFERADYCREIDHSFIIAYKKDYSLLVKSFSFPESEIEPLTMEFGHKEYAGSVVNSDGDPISGAKISAYVSSFIKNEVFSNSEEKEVAQTKWLTVTTDENGNFVISNIPLFAKAEFAIEAEGYAKQYTWLTSQPLEEMTIPVGGKPLLFSLEKTGAIRGRLFEDNTSIGIPNEKIFIVKDDDRNQRGMVWSALSGSHAVKDLEGNNREVIADEQGMFYADSLAPGSYKITLNPFVSGERKWHVETQEIDIPEGQTVEVVLSATQLGKVMILVQDANKQQPLEGVNVALKSLTVKEKEPVQGEDHSETYPVNSITFVPAGSSEEQVLVQFAKPSSDTILPVKTNGSGVAVFCITPGDYVIQSVRKSDYEYMPNEQEITVKSGAAYDLTVNMRYLPGFSGICVDSVGQTVSGVEVRQLSFSDIISTTDEEGKFQFVRESIKRITPIETRCLREDTLRPENKEWYRNSMVLQKTIFLGMHSETHKGGWFRYNWEKTFNLEVKPTVQATGKIVDSEGHPIPAMVTAYAFPGEVSWQSYDYTFHEKDFYFYEEIEVSEDGVFSLQLIPEFSYILEVIAEEFGIAQEKIITSIYDSNIMVMLKEYNRKTKKDNSFIIKKEIWCSGSKTTEKEHVIWILRDEEEYLDLGEIVLPSLTQTLSGIVVDRMGNPLEGYRVFVSGEGQLNNGANDVTDPSGHFLLSDLCEGEVEIYAEKGEYEVIQRDVKVGRDDLRIVSSDHPISQQTLEVYADDSLCDFEIVLVNQDTQERVQYEKAHVKVSSENGDSFQVKLDEESRYRTRVKEGKYTVDVSGYPLYDYNNDIEVEIKAGLVNSFTIPLKKYPFIEGVIHLPESVSINEIEVDIQPDGMLSIFKSDFEIAGDGQFTCKISLYEEVPSHGWLWVCTKDKRYVSRTKFPLNDQWLEITLLPEATVKFKRTKRNYSVTTWGWRQDEYTYKSTWALGMKGPKKDILINDEEYIGIHGLVAGQDDLSYIFNVVNVHDPIIVHSKDLYSGETKIIELPSP